MVAVFLVVWVFSIIGACISYGGFKARRRDSRIEVEHGLCSIASTASTSIAFSRSSSSRAIRRLLGCELLGKIDAAAENSSEISRIPRAPGLVIHPSSRWIAFPRYLRGSSPNSPTCPPNRGRLQNPPSGAPLSVAAFAGAADFGWLCCGHGQIVVNAVSPTNPDAQSLLFFVNTARSCSTFCACCCLRCSMSSGRCCGIGVRACVQSPFHADIQRRLLARESVSFPRRKKNPVHWFTKPIRSNATPEWPRSMRARQAGIGGTTLRLIDVTEQDAERMA